MSSEDEILNDINERMNHLKQYMRLDDGTSLNWLHKKHFHELSRLKLEVLEFLSREKMRKSK